MPTASAIRRIHASCHCGNIRVVLDWPLSGAAIAARACGCTMCTKHRGVWTSNPGGHFRLHVADEARVNLYRFGTKTADFHVCTLCGVVPIVSCEIDGTRYAVVNVNAFDDVDRSQIAENPAEFDGETTQDRLARRRRNWTPEAAAGD